MNVILTSSINKAKKEDIASFVTEAPKLAKEVNQFVPSGIQISKIILTLNDPDSLNNPIDSDNLKNLSSGEPPVDICDASQCETIKYKNENSLSGLGHWWLGSVDIAFKCDVDYVFYLPVDLDWTHSRQNTVIDPESYAQMMQAIVDKPKPDLVIGNYKTEDHTKEWVESLILGHVLGVFADHPHYDKFLENFEYFKEDKISRVRTEFWGIKRSFFNNFKLVKQSDVKSADPTLQVILNAILTNKFIKVVDLGCYKTSSSGGTVMEQLKRVESIISIYRRRFEKWP